MAFIATFLLFGAAVMTLQFNDTIRGLFADAAELYVRGADWPEIIKTLGFQAANLRSLVNQFAMEWSAAFDRACEVITKLQFVKAVVKLGELLDSDDQKVQLSAAKSLMGLQITQIRAETKRRDAMAKLSIPREESKARIANENTIGEGKDIANKSQQNGQKPAKSETIANRTGENIQSTKPPTISSSTTSAPTANASR